MSFLFPSSSISKKIVMAFTGLLLFGFLVSHLLGNLLLFVGKEEFNNYSHALVSNPAIYLAEAVLALIFLYHVILAILVTLDNRRARPVGYLTSTTLGESSFPSAHMLWSGLIILIFLAMHIMTFKFGPDVNPVAADGVRDLYSIVVTRFQDKFYSILYIFCMLIMGFHLWHAFQSACRTLGLSHPKYVCGAKILSYIMAVGFAVGFRIFPLYFGFIK